MDDIRKRQDEVRAELEQSRQRLAEFEDRRREIDAELTRLLQDKPRYDALVSVVSGLDRLAELDAEEMLWGEFGDDPRLREQLSSAHKRVAGYSGELERLNQARETAWYEIQALQGDILEHEELIQTLLEIEEQSKDDFVIEREHDHPVYRTPIMPWTKHGEDEKRYRRILLIILFLFLIFCYSIRFFRHINYPLLFFHSIALKRYLRR